MKTTSTASAFALSGILLGLPMTEGREVGGPKLTLDTAGLLGFSNNNSPPEASGGTEVSLTREGQLITAGQGVPGNDGDQGRGQSLFQQVTSGFGSLLGPSKQEQMSKSETAPNRDVKLPLLAPAKEIPVDEIAGGGSINAKSKSAALGGADGAASGESSLPEDEAVARFGGVPGLNALRQGGDDAGEGGDDQGEDNEGDETEETEEEEEETNPNLTDIKFYCDLKVDFFEEKGREPTEDEVKVLIHKTDDWLSEVFEIDPTFVSIEEEATKRVFDETTPDYFYVEFQSTVHADHTQSEIWQLSIDEISAMVDHADYELYITHFIWEGVPEGQDKEAFLFYHTQQVTLGCWHGERPVATERRRLRGITGFGGSHKMEAH